MWERPDGQSVERSLDRYLLQLKYLLDKAGVSRQFQGGILYQGSENCGVDGYLMASRSSVVQKEAARLTQSLRECSIGSGEVYSRVYNGYAEYLKLDPKSIYGSVYIYVRVKYSASEQKLLRHDTVAWRRDAAGGITAFANCIVARYLQEVSLSRFPYADVPYVEERLLLSAGNTFAAKLLEGYLSADYYKFIGDLNIASSLAYESQSNSGNLVLVPKDSQRQAGIVYRDHAFQRLPALPENVRLNIRFESPVPMSNHKRVRKLFEIATGDTYLVGDGAYIYGVATKEKLLGQGVDRYVLFKICGSLKWELWEIQPGASKPALPRIVYDSTGFKVKKRPEYKNEIKSKLEAIAKNNPQAGDAYPCGHCDYGQKCGCNTIAEIKDQDAMAEDMANVVKAATGQTHGTTIVFSMHAQEETKRLEKTCFRVEKVALKDSGLIKQITAIDGAVLCDFAGTCYAIGVILDGKTIETPDGKQAARKGNTDAPLQEDISRGARYNSAVRYKNANPCSIICIISEDGDVNFV